MTFFKGAGVAVCAKVCTFATMLGIKRLYTFMLRSFLPLLLMTFLIVLFIVLMQFLWRYIDDLVGKGLSVDVLAELFFYAALTMVPMALPLAILLASLMTFGNLGENFELTAMKASGVSLLKVMSPLIALMVFIAVGAFFFQNNVLPVAQTKMWTLLFSVRQKSPEVEIPQGVFYDQIPGINLYVQEKNRDTGILYDVMIYDMSRGFDNARVILADSARLASTDDNSHLFLKLWNGEQFENVKDAASGMKNVPYRRESFSEKELLIAFDANFNRMDEEGMRNQYVGKNITQLQATIDSVNQRVDSLGNVYAREILAQDLLGINERTGRERGGAHAPRTATLPPDVALLDVDSVFRGRQSSSTVNYLTIALNKAKHNRQEYEFKSFSMKDDRKTIRRHGIELQKKFTLSFACIIFFFIGAPLGAIIRKGGLGTPLVISVLLFIVYYIIDNTGYKMARDGKIQVWEGIWLSSAVLLPLGVFLTYKAVNDSAVFNADAYRRFFSRLVGAHETRNIMRKEVIIDEVEQPVALERIAALKAAAEEFIAADRRDFRYANYLKYGINREMLRSLTDEVEALVEYLSNSRDVLVLNKLMDFPVLRNLWIYRPSHTEWLSKTLIWFAPAGGLLYLIARRYNKSLVEEVRTVARVCAELTDIITNPTQD